MRILSSREEKNLDELYPLVTGMMLFHLIFWPLLAVAAAVLVLVFVLLGLAKAPAPAWGILIVALLGILAFPIISFFLHRKKRKFFREHVVAVGQRVIYRVEGYLEGEKKKLMDTIIRPYARKDMLSLVGGALRPVVGPTKLPEWAAVTFYAEPYITRRSGGKTSKARASCKNQNFLKISYSENYKKLQSLILHEMSHAILFATFPNSISIPEHHDIIEKSRIERTDFLGLI